MNTQLSTIANSLIEAAKSQSQKRTTLLATWAKTKEVRNQELQDQATGINLLIEQIKEMEQEYKKNYEAAMTSDLIEVNKELTENGFKPIQSLSEIVSESTDKAETFTLAGAGYLAGRLAKFGTNKLAKVKAGFGIGKNS